MIGLMPAEKVEPHEHQCSHHDPTHRVAWTSHPCTCPARWSHYANACEETDRAAAR